MTWWASDHAEACREIGRLSYICEELIALADHGEGMSAEHVRGFNIVHRSIERRASWSRSGTPCPETAVTQHTSPLSGSVPADQNQPVA
ncbi:MAG: hypothetical protein ACRDQ4_13440 [Pseudonocardiaceae bacterium]